MRVVITKANVCNCWTGGGSGGGRRGTVQSVFVAATFVSIQKCDVTIQVKVHDLDDLLDLFGLLGLFALLLVVATLALR